jgi:undecaprenyl-phosphate 4-deoxy-4-formamido-L-arabinose transferase
VSVDVILSWATTSVRSVPVRMDRREVGRSGHTFSGLVRHTWNMITGYGTLPLRLVTWMGFAASVLGFVMLVAVWTLYWTGHIKVAGFTTLVSLLTMFSGAMMLSIGILGEYLSRLHFRSMRRPMYLVRSDTGVGCGDADDDDRPRPATGSKGGFEH